MLLGPFTFHFELEVNAHSPQPRLANHRRKTDSHYPVHRVRRPNEVQLDVIRQQIEMRTQVRRSQRQIPIPAKAK